MTSITAGPHLANSFTNLKIKFINDFNFELLSIKKAQQLLNNTAKVINQNK